MRRRQRGRAFFQKQLLPLLVLVAASILALSAPAVGSSADSGPRYPILEEGDPPEVVIHTDEKALAMDVEQFAKDVGVSSDEAYTYVEQQPLIDELRLLLVEKSGDTFSDLYLAYDPYRVVVLTLGSAEDMFALISAEAAFQELLPSLEVRRVEYTESILAKAMEQVGLLAGPSAQASEADIRTGTVTVWVDSEESAAALWNAIQTAGESGDLVIPAASINVAVGRGPVLEDSFAGNDLNLQSSGAGECTSGFSVEQTGGGTLQGVSTAGHCLNNLELANGDDITFQAQRFQDNQDVQWHLTPGHTDQPWMRDSPTTVRNVTARRTRTQMISANPYANMEGPLASRAERSKRNSSTRTPQAPLSAQRSSE
jgi:hypothetical protein